jgi:hypothetical protein
MRHIKRLLILAGELSVLLFGVAFSLALVIVPAMYFDLRENGFLQLVLLFGLGLTILGFVTVRRKTRPWKIEYDAVDWALNQAERRLHPSRARYRRIGKRILVWVPSVTAAAVLFFFPAASHLIHPGSQYLGHYRVSIPWTLTVVSVPGVPAADFVTAFVSIGSNGKFVLTPFWNREIFSSAMGFGIVKSDPDTSGFRERLTEERYAGATQLLRREFRLVHVAVTCWQYLPPDRWRFRVSNIGSETLWQVDCEAPVDIRQQRFYAWFRGRAADIPVFYKIIETVTPGK